MQDNKTKYNILQWNLNYFYKRISELQIMNKYCNKYKYINKYEDIQILKYNNSTI